MAERLLLTVTAEGVHVYAEQDWPWQALRVWGERDGQRVDLDGWVYSTGRRQELDALAPGTLERAHA